MELLIIFALGKAPTMESWQSELKARKAPVEFTERADLGKHSGFLPITLHGQKSGLYFLVGNYAEIASQYAPLSDIELSHPVVYSLGYGDFRECASVFYSASVLVAAFDGKAFEPQGGLFMNEIELLAAAKQCDELAKSQ
jgi:hypothetical protein